MKKTNLKREFARYTSLNVLGMIGLSCYILADTFFVSKGLGSDGLAALNLAIPVYSFISGSGLMLGIGGATKYSISKTRGDKEGSNRIFTNTAILTVILAAIFFLIGIFLSDNITSWLGADETVFEMSKTYLKVILLFAPMFMLNNVLICFVRNDGAPQLSMMAMIGGSISNIILDYVFIFPCKMGIFGAVFATGLAPVFSMIILSAFFIKKRNSFKLTRFTLTKKMSLGIFSCGLPSLITEVSSGIVIIVFNMLILKIEGNIGVAAYGVIANLSLVVISIYTGIAQGIQPILSRGYGAGEKAQMRLVLKYAMMLVGAVSALVYAGVFFGAEQITAVFNSENNQVLQSIAVLGLKIYFIACLFAGTNIIMSIYFTSTEKPRPAHLISILRGFAVIIPMAFLLSSLAGMNGIWAAFPATEVIVAAFSVIAYLYIRKKERV